MRCNLKPKLPVVRLDETPLSSRDTVIPSYQAFADGICRLQFYRGTYCIASFCGLASHYREEDGDILLRKAVFIDIVRIILKGNWTRFYNYIHNNKITMTLGPKTFLHVLKYLEQIDFNNDITRGRVYFRPSLENLKQAQMKRSEIKLLFL